jgi:hypothetical protein
MALLVKKRWEFLLEGGSYSLLSSMCSFSDSAYFQVYEELDFMNDCSVQDYRFTSIYCNDEDDSDTVWQIGYELVSLFNGAHRLFREDFREVWIEQLWLNGNRQNFCKNYGISGLLGRPDDSDKLVATELKKVQPNSALGLLVKATEHEDVYLLLKYFDMEQNWVTYYKILETVEEWSKKKGQRLCVDSDERKRFTNVANNYSLSGIHSRHGFKANLKKNKTSAMSLDEAHTFIRNLAKQYVQLFL